MHGFCGTTQEEGCRFQCFVTLQHHIQQYTSELSKVFFRKKALQSDRRWWLSVFYSLVIQAPVRQTLLLVHGEINSSPLVRDVDPDSCSRYCYTVLNVFDAASGGWDPITSNDDLGPLLLGSDLEKKLAKHITTAREMKLKSHTHTFDYLRNLFEVDTDERVRRRVSTKRASSKDAIAMAPQSTLSFPPATRTPRFSDCEYSSTDHVKDHNSEAEFSIPLPPGPPPRFVPMEDWEGSGDYKAGVNKRRATSPPQEYDDERRFSTDSVPQLLSTADDLSDRANSISSVNSSSSINAAYGTLGLDSPGSGQSPRLMSSSPQSPIPDMHQVDIPRAMSTHDIIRQRAAKHRGTSGVGKVQGFYTCDCCPKKPKNFNSREELGYVVYLEEVGSASAGLCPC